MNIINILNLICEILEIKYENINPFCDSLY